MKVGNNNNSYIFMFQSNDDEERETLLKRQKRHEESTMRGSVNPQHAAKLLKKIITSTTKTNGEVNVS
jgi:hypothetical protein